MKNDEIFILRTVFAVTDISLRTLSLPAASKPWGDKPKQKPIGDQGDTMRGSRLAALTLALGSCALTQSACGIAQSQNPGTTVTYQIPANVYTCGNQGTQFINCNGIPFHLNGTPAGSMWLYGSINYTKYPPAQYGWGYFFAPSPMAGHEFTLGNWSFIPTAIVPHNGFPYLWTSFPCANNCSTFTGTITGVTMEGQSYTAQVSVDFWYYRAYGVRVSTVNAIVTGGTVTVRYE